MNGSKDYPLVSVLVLNLNGKEYLHRCLSSLLRTDYPDFEVVFIDNGSKDGSCEYVNRQFGSDDRLRIICLNENKGFAEGNNIGIRNARGEFLVFLNNDTVVDKNWLKELVKGISYEQGVGVAQSKLLSYFEPDVIDSVGGNLDRFGNGRDIGKNEKDRGQYDTIKEIFYATFAAAIIKRAVLREVGVFDSKFFAYYEDADLCWRTRLRGYSIVCAPQSIVYHVRRGTTKKISNLVLFHQRKNRLALLIINHDLVNLVKALSVVLFEYWAGFFVGLFLRRNMGSNVTFAKAILWNVKNFPYLFRRRLCARCLGRGSSVRIADYMYKGNFLIEKMLRDRSIRSFF